MTAVVDIALPLFGILVLGYGAVRLALFDDQAARGLSLFVFNFVVPPLLVRSMIRAELPAELPWRLLLAYYLGALIVFALGMLIGHGRGRALAAAGVVGFTAAYGNTVLMGIPLVLVTFGEAAALPLFLIIAVHSPLLMSLLTLIVELGRAERGNSRRQGYGSAVVEVGRDTLVGLVKNPVIVSLLAGLAINLSGWSLPGPVDAILEALSRAAMPCALFAMGAALARYRIVGNLPEALGLVVLKNIAHPLLVWLLAACWLNLPPLWVQTITLLAALPCGVNAYLFAQRYQVGVATVSTTIFLSTAVSMLTLPILLALLRV